MNEIFPWKYPVWVFIYLPWWREPTPHKWLDCPEVEHTVRTDSSPVGLHRSDTPPGRSLCSSVAPGHLGMSKNKKKKQEKKHKRKGTFHTGEVWAKGTQPTSCHSFLLNHKLTCWNFKLSIKGIDLSYAYPALFQCPLNTCQCSATSRWERSSLAEWPHLPVEKKLNHLLRRIL